MAGAEGGGKLSVRLEFSKHITRIRIGGVEGRGGKETLLLCLCLLFVLLLLLVLLVV